MKATMTARNRAILEQLAKGSSLMQTSVALGVAYPNVCTARTRFDRLGFDTRTEAGRAKCLEWLTANQPICLANCPLTAPEMEVVRRYAHGEPFIKMAQALNWKFDTVEQRFRRISKIFTPRPGKDRPAVIREWLVEQGYYPADHNFDAANPMQDPAFS